MADNSVQGGADTVRDLARQAGTVKTQVVQLDLGGPTANAEVLITAGQQLKAASVPVVIASDQGPYTDQEWNLSPGITGLRDQLFAQRYTVLADSIADGFAAFWSTVIASGGTAAVSIGEGLLQTGTLAGGLAQMSSTAPAYYPGQVHWLNSAIRFGDIGVAGTTLRIGACTVNGTTPWDGAFYELNGTTLNAVTVKAGMQTAVASTSWTRVAASPFTLDTNYHQFEVRWTANSANFLVDNVLRHTASGGATALTGTLNFPIFLQVSNPGGGTNRLLAVRNIGMGRFGQPDATPVVNSSMPLPKGAAQESGNLAYLTQGIEQNTQIIKLLSAILMTLGNNGGGYVDPEEAATLANLQ